MNFRAHFHVRLFLAVILLVEFAHLCDVPISPNYWCVYWCLYSFDFRGLSLAL